VKGMTMGAKEMYCLIHGKDDEATAESMTMDQRRKKMKKYTLKTRRVETENVCL
jgi:hypothetical protein